jgi:DNA-binding response OmpR family regulator
MKILLIEDDRRLSNYLGRFFELEGWEVQRAFAPGEALEVLRRVGSGGVEAILLDIMMPTDDSIDYKKSDFGQDTGLLLLEKIAPLVSGRVPIIVLTARQDLEWLTTSGKVQAYLQKTMQPEEIVEAIADCCRGFRPVP